MSDVKELLELERARKALAKANELVREYLRKHPLTYGNGFFVCDGCDHVMLGSMTLLDTSKHGHERPFCPSCVRHCWGCDEDYADTMQYQHEACRGSEDDEDEEKDDTET
jgi:hypothetical protein